MAVVEGGSAGTGLVARVKGILLSPSSEWDKIEQEPATIGGLFTGYVCILAAIPAVAGLIGGQLFGHGALGISIKPPLGVAVITAVLGYLGALVMTFVLGSVIDALAPSFGAEKNRVQAFKVAAYSGTAGWVVGVLQILPMLAVIVLLAGLYGCWLLYLGLPRVMKAPADKAPGYAIVTILVAIVVSIVMFIVVGATSMAIGRVAGFHGASPAGKMGGTVELNGQKVDLDRLQAAGERAEALSKQPRKAVSPDALKALLPESVAGYARSSVETNSSGTGDVSIVVATGEYQKDGNSFRLEVTDLGAMGAMAALASGMGAHTTKETADGYEKVATIDGRLTSEEWNRPSNSGKYSVVIADRFSVQADGSANNIDDLKQAVRAVDAGRLESLAR
ncbi:Yip1 family protein [Caulobacter sp. Root343]|jgi:roadblock/LC7 domain-containing protein|uniref:Yip1 family protein n=1 Tax=Caulobacter sp. Root343 TaxID=1736520 RepID=UPI0006F92455|nr:Yip1 family protein [Caulobacter sp. Root343]KQV62450.1 hypothetical protein ASC62_02635 [Caulobacter sp. Root342]KQV65540.1 hypothetical protein ASC70_17665 [Caulobacter sp. Root343]